MYKKSSKMFGVVIALVFTLTLTACSPTRSPESSVDTFITSYKSLDLEKAESVLASGVETDVADDSIGSEELDEFKNIDFANIDGGREFQKNAKDILKGLKHKVTNVDEVEDTAIVTVDVEYVDGSALATDMIADIFTQIMSDVLAGNEDEMTEEDILSLVFNSFNDNYEDFEKVILTDTVEIPVEKNDGGEWLISDIDEELFNILLFNVANGIEESLDGLMGGF